MNEFFGQIFLNKSMEQNNNGNYRQSPLNQQELMAIELKYLGYKYSEIATKINTTENQVSDWFRHRGKLFKEYLEYAKQNNEAIIAESKLLLKSKVSEAVETLIQLMRGGIGGQNSEPIPYSVQFKASTEIINHTIGKPELTIKTDSNMRNTFEEEATLEEKKQEVIVMLQELQKVYGWDFSDIFAKNSNEINTETN